MTNDKEIGFEFGSINNDDVDNDIDLEDNEDFTNFEGFDGVDEKKGNTDNVSLIPDKIPEKITEKTKDVVNADDNKNTKEFEDLLVKYNLDIKTQEEMVELLEIKEELRDRHYNLIAQVEELETLGIDEDNNNNLALSNIAYKFYEGLKRNEGELINTRLLPLSDENEQRVNGCIAFLRYLYINTKKDEVRLAIQAGFNILNPIGNVYNEIKEIGLKEQSLCLEYFNVDADFNAVIDLDYDDDDPKNFRLNKIIIINEEDYSLSVIHEGEAGINILVNKIKNDAKIIEESGIIDKE